MRLLLLISIFFALVSLSTAQVQVSNWRPITGQLSRIAVSPSGNIAVCGSTGIVMLSSDKGATWQQPSIGTGIYLSGVAFANDSVCVIVGGNNLFRGCPTNTVNGIILRSINGGRNWTNTTFANIGAFVNVAQQNGVFIATCDSGQVFRSTDIGLTWAPVPAQRIGKETECNVFSVADGFLTGGYQNSVWFSHDGLKWSAVSGLLPCQYCPLICARQNALGTNYALIGPTLYRSENGLQWDIVVDTLLGSFFDFVPGSTEHIVISKGDSVRLFNLTTKTYEQIIIHDPTLSPLIQYKYITSVATISTDAMLAVGANKCILLGTANGKSWELCSAFHSDERNTYFSTESIGYSSSKWHFSRTTDSGITWRAYNLDDITDNQVTDWGFSGSVMQNIGFFDSYRDSLETKIIFMPDTSSSFSILPTTLPLKGILAPTLHTTDTMLFAYFPGQQSDSVYLFSSSDKGISWNQAISTTPDVYLSFSENSEVPVFIRHLLQTNRLPGFYYTTDNGKSWKNQNLPWKQIDFLNLNYEGVGFMRLSEYETPNYPKYKGLLRTTNFGLTWNTIKDVLDSTFTECIYHKATKNWVAYDITMPRIAVSSDNGLTWRIYFLTGLENYLSIYGQQSWGKMKFTSNSIYISKYCPTNSLPEPFDIIYGTLIFNPTSVEHDIPSLEITTPYTIVPQPARGEVQFDASRFSDIHSIKVISQTGQEINVFSEHNAGLLQWNIRDWAAGMYAIVIVHSGGTTVVPFIAMQE